MKHTVRIEKNNYLHLDSYYKQLPDMTKPALAVLMGTALGFAICIGGQKLWNRYEKAECRTAANMNLVYMKTFIGDTYHCVPNYADGSYTGP